MASYSSLTTLATGGTITSAVSGQQAVNGSVTLNGGLPVNGSSYDSFYTATAPAPPKRPIEVAKKDVRDAQEAVRHADRQLKAATARARQMTDRDAALELVADAALAAGTARGKLSAAQFAYQAVRGAGGASEPIGDIPGRSLRPDPTGAKSPAELAGFLRRFRVWAGSPSYRHMAARAQQAVSYATLHAALNGDRLPSLKVVTAVIAGCGGGEQDKQLYASAWRVLALAREHSRGGPQPRLQVLPPAG